MAKGPTTSPAAQDFQGVMAYFTSKGIVSDTPTSSLIASARKLHKATYSLVLWRFRLKGSGAAERFSSRNWLPMPSKSSPRP